jgi:hypothetical protein
MAVADRLDGRPMTPIDRHEVLTLAELSDASFM